jgi:secondary thiamine-phosphate synthase enzyme
MKSFREFLTFNTSKKQDCINITTDLKKTVGKSKIKERLVLMSAMHITAGVYINDAESGLIADIDEWADKLAPFGPDYHHHRTGKDNGDAHLKNFLIGSQVVLPVTDGKIFY